ncbi:DUF5949 family protein [Streptomyces sp. NPDC088254]|uniref:DUF5949 family protein n=1 Tax=Streptomyces sp. NPDC088254 TaxID=3365847 RepID=UPI00380EE3A9
MTSTPSATRVPRAADLGTLVVVPWSGEAPDGGDMPYLLAYSLGDAVDGPEASTAAIEHLLTENKLPVGGDLVDGMAKPSLPVSLLVESGAAVLTLGGLTAQCVPPAEWLAAAEARGYAYLVVTTRPWPEAVPGTYIGPEALAAFAGAEETLTAAAHVILPARRLRS